MADTTSTAVAAEPGRFSMRLPSPLWTGIATVVLIVGAIGLRIGIPICRQDSAIRQIVRLGGSVKTEPRGPVWLRQLVGEERARLIDVVKSVELSQTDCVDADLPSVALLMPTRLSLGRVWTRNEGVSRGGSFEHPMSFVPIDGAYGDCPPITDGGLVNLLGMTNLRILNLNGSQVSDAGLKHLGGLVELKYLDLGDTRVTDAGLAHLRNLKSLRELRLRGTRISGARLVHLRALPRLERLDLGLTNVGDTEISHLNGLTTLRALGLEGTRVTDACLPTLKTLISLEYVEFHTLVTHAGIAELKSCLPNLFRFPGRPIRRFDEDER